MPIARKKPGLTMRQSIGTAVSGGSADLPGRRESASSCSCRCRTECRSTPRRRARQASAAAIRGASDRTSARLCRPRYRAAGGARSGTSAAPAARSRGVRAAAATSVWISSAAPIEQHRRQRELRRRKAVAQRGRARRSRIAPTCFSVPLRSAAAERHAGARPNSRPVAIVSAGANRSTVAVDRMISGIGSRFGGSVRVDRSDAQKRRQHAERAADRSTAPGSRRAAGEAAGCGWRPSRCESRSLSAALPPAPAAGWRCSRTRSAARTPTAHEQHEQRGLQLRCSRTSRRS